MLFLYELPAQRCRSVVRSGSTVSLVPWLQLIGETSCPRSCVTSSARSHTPIGDECVGDGGVTHTAEGGAGEASGRPHSHDPPVHRAEEEHSLSQ
ncbi:hypothetical protein EYF80_016887 [Liparis tanakae]|uniref:Uncharacterized protein n=1 Tax=Liparis tanakae TaxID=230148 RepID=A0A4Z2I4S4_9TELE|nr:hypothetical protein EYF80_016887 [Liparis tanakae]